LPRRRALSKGSTSAAPRRLPAIRLATIPRRAFRYLDSPGGPGVRARRRNGRTGWCWNLPAM
jgi:hypothetical protein